MFQIPIKRQPIYKYAWTRLNSSSSYIRSNFIEYFTSNYGHKHIKSSSVVPLSDATVPFVNAGMYQFKGVFLGNVNPPSSRVVTSQKCVRVGGKHNDLDIVGMDGHHHTFFEMLGNWSFGDYYKNEACQMAWNLLLGPFNLKPENLLVTYFGGDAVMGLREDRECRDIWKQIGVQKGRLKPMDARDNFWEMGASGPCGPCTEIHHINSDGTLTEIWNIVFIQYHRQNDGKLISLRQQHVDTGMGLERMATLLQGVNSNYDTDLFRPIIKTIEKNSNGVSGYEGRFGNECQLDTAYRRLADYARMISVCLADGAFPAASLSLKQVMGKAFKLSTDVFQNPDLLPLLYDRVAESLGSTYPELVGNERQAKLIIQHEQNAFKETMKNLKKKWKDVVKRFPEVASLGEIATTGFASGYMELKETMSKQNLTVIPGELVFKLYDQCGFQEDLIDKVAKLNNYDVDKEGFHRLLSHHKSRHKTALKEQISDEGLMFDRAIEKLIENGIQSTDDSPKYNYEVIGNKIIYKPLATRLVAILNEGKEWVDFLEPSTVKAYYLVTKETSFYCEEGGQAFDSGVIEISDNITYKVDNVFKIRNFVFHKGTFKVKKLDSEYVKRESVVNLMINSERRLSLMRNHTAVHLLNAALREVLSGSVVCPIGSGVTEAGLFVRYSVYGEKLSQKVVLQAQELVRNTINSNAPVEARAIDSLQLSREESVQTTPGVLYPENSLRLVTASPPLLSKELCCGTHVPSTGFIEEFCITLVKGAGTNKPVVHALTGPNAKEARELFCHADKLAKVFDLASAERRLSEVTCVRERLQELCGAGGAPYGDYKDCLHLLSTLQKKTDTHGQMELQALAESEVRAAVEEAEGARRSFAVHFVRCSYLMRGAEVAGALAACAQQVAPRRGLPLLLVGCGGGMVSAACALPPAAVSASFSADKWMRCILPVFDARLAPPTEPTRAQMTATKVSLIDCELLVQDAMRVAIKFAQSHGGSRDARTRHGSDSA